MKTGLNFWETSWLILGLIFFSSSLSLLYAPDASDTLLRVESKDYLTQILNFPIYFFVLYISFLKRNEMMAILWKNKILIVMLVIPFASIAWSIEPLDTFNRSVFLLLTTLLSVGLCCSCDRDQIVRLFLMLFFIAGVLTITAPIINFATAIHQDVHYPALRGFFRFKNITGRFFVLSVALSLYVYLNSRSFFSIVTLIISSAIVVLTLSGTALVLMFFVYLLFAGLLIVGVNKKISFIALFILFVLMPILFILIIYSDFYLLLFDILGKDTTLTGRTTIWQVIWSDILPYSPWLGYGYEAFWSSFQGAFSVHWGMFLYIPPHAHNAIFHTLVNLGLLGALILCYFVFDFIYRSSRRFLLVGDYFSILCIVLSFYILVVNMTEVVLLQNSFIWLFLVCFYIKLGDDKSRLQYK